MKVIYKIIMIWPQYNVYPAKKQLQLVNLYHFIKFFLFQDPGTYSYFYGSSVI